MFAPQPAAGPRDRRRDDDASRSVYDRQVSDACRATRAGRPSRPRDLSCADSAHAASRRSTSGPDAPGASRVSRRCKHESSNRRPGGSRCRFRTTAATPARPRRIRAWGRREVPARPSRATRSSPSPGKTVIVGRHLLEDELGTLGAGQATAACLEKRRLCVSRCSRRWRRCRCGRRRGWLSSLSSSLPLVAPVARLGPPSWDGLVRIA